MSSGSKVTVMNCDIYDNQSGLFYYDSSKGIVQGCNIHHNRITDCFVRSDSNPIVENSIFHNSSYGVISEENGSGIFNNITIHTCEGSGVLFKNASTTEIRKSKIYNCSPGSK